MLTKRVILLKVESYALEQLDTVLSCLWANMDKRLFLSTIAELLKDEKSVPFGHILSILKKLEKDEYVEYDDSAVADSDFEFTFRVYRITFDGRVWMERGGFLGDQVRRAAENTRLESIEANQKFHRLWMTWLTAILAVGTVIAALYYATELYWNHGWFHLRK